MRAYADSSFILKLLGGEPGSDEVVAAFSRSGRPSLFLVNLHEVEIRNAILQRAFHQRRSKGDRRLIAQERDRAMARLENRAFRRKLQAVEPDAEIVHRWSMELVQKHTERIGARAIDILHVANALALESELFLTTDLRQAELAQTEGLHVEGIN